MLVAIWPFRTFLLVPLPGVCVCDRGLALERGVQQSLVSSWGQAEFCLLGVQISVLSLMGGRLP